MQKPQCPITVRPSHFIYHVDSFKTLKMFQNSNKGVFLHLKQTLCYQTLQFSFNSVIIHQHLFICPNSTEKLRKPFLFIYQRPRIQEKHTCQHANIFLLLFENICKFYSLSCLYKCISEQTDGNLQNQYYTCESAR